MIKKILIAVCCELRTGLRNNKIFKDSIKVGDFLSNPEFQLIKVHLVNDSVGLKKGNHSVVFEVYETNFLTSVLIDGLKGYKSHDNEYNAHDKQVLDTPYGEAIIYLEKHTKITDTNIILDYDYLDYYEYKQKVN